jgi:cation transport regulator ChaB
MDSEPLAVIKIGGTDGVIIPLHIFRDDDPAVLAKKFVVENGLPNEIILKLSAQIQSHISQALMSCNEMLKDKQLSGSDSDDDSVESVTNQFSMLLNRGSQYRHFDGNSNLTPSTSTHLDRDENIISQTPSHSHHFEESFNKAKETWSSTANRSLMDIRRPESMLSNMKKSRSDSNLNVSLSGSVNGDARSVSRPRSPSALSIQTTPNRPVYDRLYQEAGHSQQRLNHLRERVEEEREEAVRSSSFM